VKNESPSLFGAPLKNLALVCEEEKGGKKEDCIDGPPTLQGEGGKGNSRTLPRREPVLSATFSGGGGGEKKKQTDRIPGKKPSVKEKTVNQRL